jgi:pimeloyl-ACP methyl ester carboxylesterase
MSNHLSDASPHPESPRLSKLEPALFQGLGGWISIPPVIDPQAPVLVAVHGVGRDAKAQAAAFAHRASAQGRMVVAPRFGEVSWPGYQRLGNRGRRADLALVNLLDLIAFRWQVNTRRLYLFGYSGGAQFAHRFALLHPHRVLRLNLCSSGWYTWPTDAAFPMGLGDGDGSGAFLGQVARSNFGRLLQMPMQVMVGSEDRHTDDRTRSNAELDQLQGKHRLERAHRWVAALRQESLRRGLQPRAELTELTGAGHDFKQCLASGELLERVLPAARARQQHLGRLA